MTITGIRRTGTALTLLGLTGLILVYAMSFFWVGTDFLQGVAQRIFYVHVPAAWTCFLAFGIAALTSGMYLWLRDDRLDRAAVCAAEGGMVFGTIMLTTGPLWGALTWNRAWNWEPRLILTLLLWFIFLGYFMVRGATEDPEKGKRFAAVVAIIGALDIPLIHLSVSEWFRNRFVTLHPTPVVMNPDEGPTLDGDMLTVLLTSLTVFTLIFFGLFLLRYALEGFRAEIDLRARHAGA